MFFDRGNHYEFLSLVQELAAPGELQHPQTFDFNFKNVEKQYESYNGINVKLRYFTRVERPWPWGLQCGELRRGAAGGPHGLQRAA
ncbi:hypothetical protein BN1708_000446, partial [Verticillium longisporum]